MHNILSGVLTVLNRWFWMTLLAIAVIQPWLSVLHSFNHFWHSVEKGTGV